VWSIPDTDYIVNQLERKISSIISNGQMPFTYEFSIRLVEFESWWEVVLATGHNCQVGSCSGSTQNRTVATGLTTRKTRIVGNALVLPPESHYFKLTVLAPIIYLGFDCITTQSECILCSVSRALTVRFHICYPTDIC
jgi:hypothetical protein